MDNLFDLESSNLGQNFTNPMLAGINEVEADNQIRLASAIKSKKKTTQLKTDRTDEDKLPIISMSATENIEEKSYGKYESYDELTGLTPGDSIVTSMPGIYDRMTGEAFILPPTEEEESSDILPTIQTRSSRKSSQEAPVHVFYINGINTTNKQYKESFPLIENLLDQTNIKNNYTLHKNTYNKSGNLATDLLQSVIQGSNRGGNFNTVEGSKFDEKVVKKIEEIDGQEKKEGHCEDNPRAKFLIISHSQGNFFAEEIYNKLQDNIKERTKILAISPFTAFEGINNKNFDYLLRKDDYPNVLKKPKFLKKFPGISVPKDKSGLLGKWPGKPNGFPGDRNAHKLENYLDPDRHREGSRKDKLVEKSFNLAKKDINNLMRFDSSHYQDNEEGCVEVTASFTPSGNPWAISELYLVSPERKYIGTAPNNISGLNNDAGKTVSLGKFPVGTELKFETDVIMYDDLDKTKQIDKFKLSSTNPNQAKLAQWWDGYGTLGFEDSYSGYFLTDVEFPDDFNDTEVYLNGANFSGNKIIVIE